MPSRFTEDSIKHALRRWTQAISTDEGDLRRLHEWAAAGAQKWGERIGWPDYLWLGADEVVPAPNFSPLHRSTVYVASPTLSGPVAHFSSESRYSATPPAGQQMSVKLSNRIEAFIELKVVTANVGGKLAKHRPGGQPWPEYLRNKLDHCFGAHLRDANRQVGFGHRLLGLEEACGVAVIIYAGPANLPREIVGSYINDEKEKFPNLDAIIYLSDDDYPKPAVPLAAVRPSAGHKAWKFVHEFNTMLHAFEWKKTPPRCRVKNLPDLLMRIETDERSKRTIQNWCTGWRLANDPCPIPAPSYTISFVPRKEFKPGLQ